jgi:hypothetical protein
LAKPCPECNGELVFDSVQRRFSCRKCALFVSGDELAALRRRKYELMCTPEDEARKRQKEQDEILTWWLSPKE